MHRFTGKALKPPRSSILTSADVIISRTFAPTLIFGFIYFLTSLEMFPAFFNDSILIFSSSSFSSSSFPFSSRALLFFF